MRLKLSVTHLTLIAFFYSLASSASGLFLPSYFLQAGLTINQMVILWGVMFIMLGILPIIALKFLARHFERLLGVGLLLQVAFYAMLGTVKDPVILGLVQGVSLAAFWPSFNLLLLKSTRVVKRSDAVSVIGVAVPRVASIVGPLLGGVVISLLRFGSLFALSIVFLLLALASSTRIKYAQAKADFKLRNGWLIILLGVIVAINGFSNSIGYIAYPLFVNKLSGSFLNAGLLVSAIGVVFIAIALVVGRMSHVERKRIDFVVLGIIVYSAWLIAMAYTQDATQFVAISVLLGLAGTFSVQLFSIYGDFFKRNQYATAVALWEVFLMIGRVAGLAPVSTFISGSDFRSYFILFGAVSLTALIPMMLLKLWYSSGRIRVDGARD